MSKAASTLNSPFKLAEFTIDPAAGVLIGPAGQQQLDPKVMDVLLVLAESVGTVVPRDALFDRVWPGVVVTDYALSRCIYQLRRHFSRAGGGAHDGALIETLTKRGYRLNALPPVLVDSSTQPAESDEGMPRPLAPCAMPFDETSTTDAARGTSKWRRRALVTAVGVVGMALLVGLLLELRDNESPRKTPVAPAPSVAVLPFVNMSTDLENQHFADGLTEELIGKLSAIRGLDVAARTSSFAFRDSQLPATEIAAALQVNHLLEGSVRRAGDRLRISAQLIDVRTGRYVWSETFDRHASDIFSVQENIAFATAAALKVSLLEADEFRVRKHGTEDAEAHRLYVIARAHLLGHTKDSDLSVAKLALDEAIARDPDFAAAHAALSRYYLHFRGERYERERLGMEAAERAVALDSESAEALQARGVFRFWRHLLHGDYGDFVAGQMDLQRAIELDPTNSLVFEDLGRWLLWHEPDHAATLLERAIELDVLCRAPNFMIAMLLGTRGDLDAGRKRCLDLLQREPELAVCAMAIGTLEAWFGQFDSAVRWLAQAEPHVGSDARIQLWSIHLSIGDRAGAERWMEFSSLAAEQALDGAARFAMDARYAEALALLEQRRADSNALDVTTARFALLSGKPDRARELIEGRLPDVASGIEPISAYSVIPALDLATALGTIGSNDAKQALLARITRYLDGPKALRIPMFAVQRARAHALSGESELAFRALDRAYTEGFRTLWALDVRPQSHQYVDPIEADPAFAAIRTDPRFMAWLARISSDNARKFGGQTLTAAVSAKP